MGEASPRSASAVNARIGDAAARGSVHRSPPRETTTFRDRDRAYERPCDSPPPAMVDDLRGRTIPYGLKPVKQRKVVHYLMGRYQVSERRAVRAARFCLSSIRYESCRDPLTAVRQRLRELAQTRVRFGYRRLLVLLQRDRKSVV